MNLTYETHGSDRSLVYSVAKNDDIDTLTVGMLENNELNGIAKAKFENADDGGKVIYDVAQKKTVKELFSGFVTRGRLIGFMQSVTSAVETAYDYMIEQSSLLFDTEYIFQDEKSNDAVMICLPIADDKQKTDLMTFFKTVVFSLKFDMSEDVKYVVEIVNYFNSNDKLNTADFHAFLDKLGNAQPQNATGSAMPQPVNVSKPNGSGTVVPQPVNVNKPNVGSAVVPQPVNVNKPNGGGAVVPQPVNINRPNGSGAVVPQPVNINKPTGSGTAVSQPVNINEPNGNCAVPPQASNMNKAVSSANGSSKTNAVVIPQGNAAPQPVPVPSAYGSTPQPIPVPPAQSNIPQPINAKSENVGNKSNGQEKRGFFDFLQHHNKEKDANKAQSQGVKSQQNRNAVPSSIPVMPNMQQQQSPLPNGQPNVPQQMPISITNSQPNVPPQIPLSNGQSNVSQQTPQSNNSPQPINVPPFAKPQTPVSAPSVPRGTAVRAVSNPFVNSDVQNPLQSFSENRERDDASVMDDITVAAEPIPFLIREKDNHKVLIDKPVFRIGKERGYVDFCIDDNIAISRSHANIVKKENDYFIVDTGSTNHTYVDGKQIPNRTEVKLLHESKIKLANESFVFRIY